MQAIRSLQPDRLVPDLTPGDQFDNLTALACTLTGAQTSLISIIDFSARKQVFKSAHGLPEHLRDIRETPLSQSFCKLVVDSDETLSIADARVHPLVRQNPAIDTLGVVAYLGVPVRDAQDRPIGALCAIQPEPHCWSEAEQHQMELLGACVTDAIRARDALRLANALRDSETMRGEIREFTYALSHDLKSPANTLALLLGELRHQLGETDPGVEVTEILDLCQSSVERMRNLVEDILCFVRIIEVETEFETVDLFALITALKSELAVDLAAIGARMNIDALPTISGNAAQLQVLFGNLVENCIKFRDPARPLVINIGTERLRDGRRRILVSDNGIGIAAPNHDRIFGLFQRLQPRAASDASGIGLTLCRRIAENHGGDLVVTSALGKGATFHLDLYGVL